MGKSKPLSLLFQLPRSVYLLVSLMAPVFFISPVGAAEEDDPRLKEPMEVVADKPEASDFTLNAFDGRTFTLSEHRGKWVFVHFWSIYCPHCTREISALDQLYEAYKAVKTQGEMNSQIEWIAVNFGDAKDKIIEWASANDIDLSEEEDDTYLLLDEEKSVTRSWKIFGLPSSFFVDPEGRIVLQAIGERNWTTPAIIEQLEEWIP